MVDALVTLVQFVVLFVIVGMALGLANYIAQYRPPKGVTMTQPPTSMPSGSAIPLWLQSILPTWFFVHAPFTEFLWAAFVAFIKTALTVLYSLWVGYAALAQLKGFDVTFEGYWHIVVHGWFAVAAPLVWGLYNGGVAGNKAAAAQPKTP